MHVKQKDSDRHWNKTSNRWTQVKTLRCILVSSPCSREFQFANTFTNNGRTCCQTKGLCSIYKALLKTRAAKQAARNYFASFRETCVIVDKLEGQHSGRWCHVCVRSIFFANVFFVPGLCLGRVLENSLCRDERSTNFAAWSKAHSKCISQTLDTSSLEWSHKFAQGRKLRQRASHPVRPRARVQCWDLMVLPFRSLKF